MAESRSIQNASLDQEFKKRAQQVLSTEPILSVKDLEVQFTLRGQKLNAIRRCSLDLYDGERWPSWARAARASRCSQRRLSACWTKTAP